MAPRDSLVDLARAIGVLIDDALIELSDVKAMLSPPLIHQVKGTLFTINYYEDFTMGDTVTPESQLEWHTRAWLYKGRNRASSRCDSESATICFGAFTTGRDGETIPGSSDATALPDLFFVPR